MDKTASLHIMQNREKHRFEADIDGMTAVVEYMEMGKKIIFTHTEVPEAFEGQGIGAKLARGVLDYARENGLKVMPLCPFIAAYIRRHPEYQDLVVEGFAL